MDEGSARQPRSPRAFLSGGWATFPMLATVPCKFHLLMLYMCACMNTCMNTCIPPLHTHTHHVSCSATKSKAHTEMYENT